MLMSARLGPGSPDSFMKAFDIVGWHITLSVREADHDGLIFKGGEAATARVALAGSLFDHANVAPDLAFAWEEVGKDQPAPTQVLTFGILCDGEVEIRGALILDRAQFRLSNSKSEIEFLSPIISHVLALARERIAVRQVELFKSVSSKLSISLIVVSRCGGVILEVGDGLKFVSEVLNLHHSDPCSVQRRIESILTRYEAIESNRALNGASTTCSSGKGEANAESKPYRIVRLKPDTDMTRQIGPCYAIVEAKEIEMPDPQTLCDHYALTPAEARVVGCLIGGVPVPDISRDLSLSNHTVRTYLKRSYGKIGVNGQVQLMSKMSRLSCSFGQLPRAVIH